VFAAGLGHLAENKGSKLVKLSRRSQVRIGKLFERLLESTPRDSQEDTSRHVGEKLRIQGVEARGDYPPIGLREEDRHAATERGELIAARVRHLFTMSAFRLSRRRSYVA
jgi:hypothetical protein